MRILDVDNHGVDGMTSTAGQTSDEIVLSLNSDSRSPYVANVSRQLMHQTHMGTWLRLWLTGTPNTFMTLEVDPLQIMLEFTHALLFPKLGQSIGSRVQGPGMLVLTDVAPPTSLRFHRTLGVAVTSASG